MDADIREAERDGDVQKQFIRLIRSGQKQEAFALAQDEPIHTECTIEYHYSYSFRRNSGVRHRTGLTRTIDDLVPEVAKSIRQSHITRGMEINEFPPGLKETRGSLIRVPVVILHGLESLWPLSDLFPHVICPTDELKDFLRRVTALQKPLSYSTQWME